MPKSIVKKSSKKDKQSNTPPVLIFQWLAYAFWGWCGVALIWLSSDVFRFYFNRSAENFANHIEPLSYVIAALIVLLASAVVCDWLFSRKESTQKTGASSIIMIIHAILFCLWAIGSLIAVVFSLVSMSLSDNDKSSTLVLLLSACVSFVFSASLALRTMLYGHTRRIRSIHWAIGILMAASLLVAVFAGPVAEFNRTRNDRNIINTMSSLTREINDYVSTNQKLPESLDKITISQIDASVAKEVLNNKLIDYKPNTKPFQKSENYDGGIYYYQLCATFVSELENKYNTMRIENSDGYSNYIGYGQPHPAGYHCFKLIASSIK